jgi:uncharacterized protein (TIGR01244 family)
MSPPKYLSKRILPAAAFLLLASICLAETAQLGLLNEKHPLPDVVTAGQPTVEQLAAAQAAGYKTIVNLRPAAEVPELDEAAEARKLGFEYVAIPVAGAADLTEEKARQLLALLNDEGKKPMLVHCGSSNRVGALVAVGRAKLEGKGADEALALGKEAGLTSLEPAVRQILGLPPLPPAEPQAGKPGG